MTEHTDLRDTFTAIAEQVRLRVIEEYPAVKVTNVDCNAGIFYPITYGDLSNTISILPGTGNISFRVVAFEILPDQPYHLKHIFAVAFMPDGLQIVGKDTRRALA